MATRDDPDTVPPPAGEDDAYNAATRVGAMPPEVLARLRSEAADERARRSSAPVTAPPLPKKPPLPSDLLPSVDDPMYDSSPPTAVRDVPQNLLASQASDRPAPLQVPALVDTFSSAPPKPVVETPVAFGSPDSGASSQPPVSSAVPAAKKDDTESALALGTRSNTRMSFVVVAAVLGLVVLAFVMALVSQRR